MAALGATDEREAARGPSQRIHLIALFEGLKGLLVLLAGFELLSFVHKDLHRAAVQLVEHFHLNPASRYPTIFLDALEGVNDRRLWMLAAGAGLYAVLRFIEAAGLWYGRKWAEWFGLVTAGIYTPFEVYDIARGGTWPPIVLLTINLAVVVTLLVEISESRPRRAGNRS